MQRRCRKQPDRRRLAACDAVEEHVNLTGAAGDRADPFAVRRQWIGARAVRAVADQRQPCRESGIEHDEELVGQIFGRLTGQASVEVLPRELVLASPGRVEKAQDSASRIASAERVRRRRLGCLRLRAGRPRLGAGDCDGCRRERDRREQAPPLTTHHQPFARAKRVPRVRAESGSVLPPSSDTPPESRRQSEMPG